MSLLPRVPAGRQLPQLRVLVASMCLLESWEGLVGMMRCAEQLEELDLSIGEYVLWQ